MANNKDFKVKNGIQPTVYHEGLGTVTSGSSPWSISATSYDNKSFLLSSQDNEPRQIFIKPDGTKLYLAGGTNTTIYQYSLSTAWDISTASYDSVSFGVSGQGASFLRGIDFKSDGTKMFVGSGGNATVYQYSLSTAWDLSSASYDSVSFSTSTQSSSLQNVVFKTDGTKMYANSYEGFGVAAIVWQYSLSTAWDLSSASYESKSLSVAANGVYSAFKPDGTRLYVGDFDEQVTEYSLSTAWDISTGTATGNTASLSGQLTSLTGFIFKPDDGTKLYAVGQDNDTIYQYSTVLSTAELDLSTGSVFDLTPTSDIQINLSNPAASGTVSQATLLLDGGVGSSYDLSVASYDDVSFSVSSQENLPYDVDFKPDGTEMYVTGTAGVDLNQYTLSTAWDITTASFTQNFSYSSQDNSPYASSFKPDGTKLFMVGASNDTVFQYSLSTAWDISTASYDSVSFSVSSQTTVPVDIAFKSDGTKMYIVSTTTTEGIYQYSLSTAWDLSTASYDSVFFNTTSQSSNLFGIEFSSDGTKMFTAGINNDDIYQYSLSTAWDLSTASYDSVELNVTAQDGGMAGITFKSDGTKMFLSGSSNDKVYQYSVASSATITYPSTLEWPSGTAPTSPAIGDTDVLTFTTSDGGTTYQAVQAIDGAA